ncbi:HDOD domain-containing protein [Syntrophorhabdus aromaticivorans]|jgi:putative nucleotidyltransferase with HDIG domain|uniref:HDOD domain-containing protein n=1 Tax=Syntrophorhabdus aromaticivorans TaxID=328301 RepID=A0A351U767_9BACT|nr:HDOD domain-containing protein [Syntrophorhabdus aromaticivorans]NLW35219.1 HDOD domain-containing protein [Syntrophorhabdus aromaticivorans]HBA55798.1 HDOD domain-containing protein [Syntrophorhabdus aromaticivorans]
MVHNFARKVEKVINLLPPIPVVMTELIEALGDENIEINTLAKIISKDPLMSMNVLKVANSAFYRLPRKVNTVDHAVKMLGITEITMICVACGAYRSLMPPPNTETLDLDEFWRHSVTTGIVGKRLCHELEILDHNVVYFIGLLHDVGKVILDRYAHDLYQVAVKVAREKHIPLCEAEKRLIGESHDQVGGWVMEKWALPWMFVDATRCHHSVSTSPRDKKAAVAIVALADQLAWVQYFGLNDSLPGIKDSDAYKALEETIPTVGDVDFPRFLQELQTANEEIDEMDRILRA